VPKVVAHVSSSIALLFCLFCGKVLLLFSTVHSGIMCPYSSFVAWQLHVCVVSGCMSLVLPISPLGKKMFGERCSDAVPGSDSF